MKLLQIIQEKFWIPVSLSIILALLLPPINKNFNFLVILFVMMNFFLASLKIDFIDIINHIKKPLFLTYILVIYLLIIPFVVYWLFYFVSPQLAIGMLLLTAMPPGASTPMLTNIFKGNSSLSMTISIVSYLISPFTILLLFFVLTQKIIALDLKNLFLTLILINFLPLIVAQIIRKLNKKFIERTQKFYSPLGILGICGVIFFSVSQQAKEILHTPLNNLLISILWLYIIFIILYFVSYFIAFWKNKHDKTAIAVTKAYMNNGLALGIAVSFFSPQVALLIVLSEIPWGTTLSLFKYFLKHLK
jgi:predicted Na+-dependent transporter